MFFWSIVLFFVVVITQGDGLQLKELVKSLLPITQQRYWFMTTYLLMYILTPALHAAIDRLEKEQFRKVLLLYFLFFIVLQSIIVWREFTAVNERSTLFFCFLYMVGAYFRKYPSAHRKRWLRLYLGSCALMTLYRIVMTAITSQLFGVSFLETMWRGYSSVLCVTGAIGLFMTFVTMRHQFGKLTGKLVTFASPLTLGVYLIHENASLRAPLWGMIGLDRFVDQWYLVFMLFAASLGIFVVCLLLEWLRTKLFHCCKIDDLVSNIGDRLDRLAERMETLIS